MRRSRRGCIFVPAARKLQPQKITKGEIDAILRRLQTIDDWSKAFGCRMGLIGDSGIKVWRYLASYMAKGWACFPSYRHIAKKTRLARSTVAEALARLKRVGALNWMQRPGRKNGRRVQGTNLYTVHMPDAKAHELPILKRVRKRAAAVVTKAVASVVKSASRSSFFSGSGEQTHGAMTYSNSDRLSAALARYAAAREGKSGGYAANGL